MISISGLPVAECEGDMGGILDSVMCSREEDEERFRTTIDQAIKAKKVKAYKVKKKIGLIIGNSPDSR